MISLPFHPNASANPDGEDKLPGLTAHIKHVLVRLALACFIYYWDQGLFRIRLPVTVLVESVGGAIAIGIPAIRFPVTALVPGVIYTVAIGVDGCGCSFRGGSLLGWRGLLGRGF